MDKCQYWDGHSWHDRPAPNGHHLHGYAVVSGQDCLWIIGGLDGPGRLYKYSTSVEYFANGRWHRGPDYPIRTHDNGAAFISG